MPVKLIIAVKANSILLLLLLCINNKCFSQTEEKQVPVIELTGSAYNRGLQHGRLLKNEIANVYAKWKKNIAVTVNGDADSTLLAFKAATNFETAAQKYSPAIVEEIKGIADGSGQLYKDVFAFQLVDEFWIYLDQQFNTGNHHCSGMGVAATSGHPAYLAQNVDLENYMHGFQVLLHIAANADQPEQYVLSCAGLVALAGMNGKGIGLCMNTLMELQASTHGLPVAFIVRSVLSKQNGKEAMDFLKTVKHASGQNYILGVADSVYNFEASANQVLRFFPKPGEPSIVYHTNHALVNHDVKPWYKKYHEQVLAGQTKNRNSEARFAALEERLNKPVNDFTTELIKSTLSSKDNERNPVCRTYKNDGRGFTFSSVIYTLGKKRSIQLTYGSPDQSVYKEYFFKPVQ